MDQALVVRVGDFGLTRDIYTSHYYQAHQGAKIPVKWMAPEALNDRISNEKTDVVSIQLLTESIHAQKNIINYR